MSREKNGFTLLEVLVSLAILGVAVASLASVNHGNRMKSERSILRARQGLLMNEKLAEILLEPPPTAPEEGTWQPFVDATDAEVETDLVWRKTVTELPMKNPEGGGTLPGRSLWEIRLEVAPAADPEGEEAVEVIAWTEPPPTPGAGG